MTQKEQVGTAFNSGEVTLIDADITGSNELGYSGSYEVWEYNTTGSSIWGSRPPTGCARKRRCVRPLPRPLTAAM